MEQSVPEVYIASSLISRILLSSSSFRAARLPWQVTYMVELLCHSPVAVMQFYQRYVVLSLLWKLLSYAWGLQKYIKKITQVANGGMYLVSVGFFFLTQLCSLSNVCIGAWTHIICVYTKLTFHLHHARHSCSVFTALWYSCSAVKLTFYLHQTPSWLWLVWNNLGMDQLAQLIVQLLSDFTVSEVLCQVRKYPDSTIPRYWPY